MPAVDIDLETRPDEASGLVRIMNQLDDLDDTAFIAANYDIDDDEMAQLQEQLG